LDIFPVDRRSRNKKVTVSRLIVTFRTTEEIFKVGCLAVNQAIFGRKLRKTWEKASKITKILQTSMGEALGHTSFQCFGFSCQFSSHQLLDIQ
jgi:hypothetical protein